MSQLQYITQFLFNLISIKNHSHKKRKDSLDGSMNRALFTAELGFPKILVPRLPQNSSNVNIDFKTTVFFYVTSFLES